MWTKAKWKGNFEKLPKGRIVRIIALKKGVDNFQKFSLPALECLVKNFLFCTEQPVRRCNLSWNDFFPKSHAWPKKFRSMMATARNEKISIHLEQNQKRFLMIDKAPKGENLIDYFHVYSNWASWASWARPKAEAKLANYSKLARRASNFQNIFLWSKSWNLKRIFALFCVCLAEFVSFPSFWVEFWRLDNSALALGLGSIHAWIANTPSLGECFEKVALALL